MIITGNSPLPTPARSSAPTPPQPGPVDDYAPLLQQSDLRAATQSLMESAHSAITHRLGEPQSQPGERSAALREALEQAKEALPSLGGYANAGRALCFQALAYGLQAGALDGALLTAGQALPVLPGGGGPAEQMNPLPEDEDRYISREKDMNPLHMQAGSRGFEQHKLAEASSVIATVHSAKPEDLENSFRVGYRFSLLSAAECQGAPSLETAMAEEQLSGINVRAAARELYTGMREQSPAALQDLSRQKKEAFLAQAATVTGIVKIQPEHEKMTREALRLGLEAGLADGALSARYQQVPAAIAPDKLAGETSAIFSEPVKFVGSWRGDKDPGERLYNSVTDPYLSHPRDGFLGRDDLSGSFSSGYGLGRAVASHREGPQLWQDVQPAAPLEVVQSAPVPADAPETALAPELLDKMKQVHLTRDSYSADPFHQWVERLVHPKTDERFQPQDVPLSQRVIDEGLYVYDRTGNDYRASSHLEKAFGEIPERESEKHVLEKAASTGWPSSRKLVDLLSRTHDNIRKDASIRDGQREYPRVTLEHLDAWMERTRTESERQGRDPEAVMWDCAGDVYRACFRDDKTLAEVLAGYHKV